MENLDDKVTDPVARAKLAGIQESIFSINQEMTVLKKAIDQKIGAASAIEQVGKRVFELCIPIQQTVKDGKVEPAEAKLTINGIKLSVKMCHIYEAELRKDINDMRGQVSGMERIIVKLGARFNDEAQKFERYERMEDESTDELGRDELGRGGDPDGVELQAEEPTDDDDDGNGTATD